MANRYVSFAEWELAALRRPTMLRAAGFIDGKLPLPKTCFRRPVWPRAHSAELSRIALPADSIISFTVEQRVNSLRASFRSTANPQMWEVWAPHDLSTPIMVREQWAMGPGEQPLYRAGYVHEGVGPRPRWRPANAMPMKIARYQLIINAARIERLQDITEEVARDYEAVSLDERDRFAGETYRSEFAALWEGTYGKTHPWNESPFVWVFSFMATPVYDRNRVS